MKYKVIYADPPWSYGDKCMHRGGAERHYMTMKPQDLLTLPVFRIAAENSALFMWVTGPWVVSDFPQRLMLTWGFVPKTVAFTWIKTTKNGKLAWGMGRYTRANPEFCLLGIRGRFDRASAGVHSVIQSPRMRHSEKPPEARERIVELCGDVPRVELFCRRQADGWDAWGNEVDSSPEVDRALEVGDVAS